MRRANFILSGLLLLILTAAPAAQAQDEGFELTLSGDDITVTEDGDESIYSVTEPGAYDVTVTGSGFSIDVFVLQCPGAGGSPEALLENDPTTVCDLGNLQPASPDADGTFEVTFEAVEVDACGLVFAAGDTAQTESAVTVLQVEDQGETAVCAVVASSDIGYDDDDVADTEVAGVSQDADDDEATDNAGEDGELASTGLASGWLVGIGLGILAVGGLVLFEGRRIANRSA